MGSGTRVRFAPSPTGALHLGGARTALFNWLFARHTGGKLVLRIEDTDRQRSLAEHEQAIVADLSWLGLGWDEGPDRDGPCGPYRQSQRAGIYEEQLQRLVEGGWVYPCFCSVERLDRDRQAQRGQGLAPRYLGHCRALQPGEASRRQASGERHLLRFRLEEAVARSGAVVEDRIRGLVDFRQRRFGDPILWRSEGGATYNLAVVIDDALMEISHVIRGEDHLPNTPLQIHLCRALEKEPPVFAHLPLVMGPGGKRLSKRTGSQSVADLRQQGYLPEALRNYLALLGWSSPDGEEVLPTEVLIRHFDLDRVGQAASAFDPGKLAFLNGVFLRRLEDAELEELAVDELVAAGFLPPRPEPAARALARDLALLFAERLSTMAELVTSARLVFDAGTPELSPAEREVVAVFAAALPDVGSSSGLQAAELQAGLTRAGEQTGLKGRRLFHPIRLALTGHPSGPALPVAVQVIDQAAALALPQPVLSARQRLARVLEGCPDEPPPG